ncbi:MAG TPA: hypothetical protein VFE53_22175 [Mucilaginibacter sp.]|jgi:hypothetical protein|nr:hypothetical protein [Mucilaginibacter sp.]
MHPYLTRLGVRQEVQEYFESHLFSNEAGDLCFPYVNEFEHYGFGFHRVPVVSTFWMAGNLNFSQVRQAIVCGSAMECIAWLNHYGFAFPDTESLLFLSAGASLHHQHIRWLRENLTGKDFDFVFGKDLLGRLTALKLAAGIRGQQMHIAYLAEEKIQILFRGRNFIFSPENLSLNALEKLSGFRFRVRISTPKNYKTFFEQLEAGAGLSF